MFCSKHACSIECLVLMRSPHSLAVVRMIKRYCKTTATKVEGFDTDEGSRISLNFW